MLKYILQGILIKTNFTPGKVIKLKKKLIDSVIDVLCLKPTFSAQTTMIIRFSKIIDRVISVLCEHQISSTHRTLVCRRPFPCLTIFWSVNLQTLLIFGFHYCIFWHVECFCHPVTFFFIYEKIKKNIIHFYQLETSKYWIISSSYIWPALWKTIVQIFFS